MDQAPESTFLHMDPYTEMGFSTLPYGHLEMSNT